MRHIVGKLSTSSFQRYKVCANRSSDEGVMAPGSRGIGAVFVHSSGEDSDQTGDAFGEPRVPRRSRSHYLSNAPGLADQLVASRKDSAREGGSCAAYFCKVPDSRESELGLVRYGPASRVHRGVFGPFEGSFPIRIPADPDKFLAIREFHVVHGCVLFPMCPGSQINLLRVRKTLCASAATSVGKFRKFQHSLISSACFHARGRRSSRCRISDDLGIVGKLALPTFQRGGQFDPVFGLVNGPVKPWSNLVNLGQTWSKFSKLLGNVSRTSFQGFLGKVRTLVGLGNGFGQTSVKLGQLGQTWSTLVKLGQTLGNVSRTFFLGVFEVMSPRRNRPTWFKRGELSRPIVWMNFQTRSDYPIAIRLSVKSQFVPDRLDEFPNQAKTARQSESRIARYEQKSREGEVGSREEKGRKSDGMRAKGHAACFKVGPRAPSSRAACDDHAPVSTSAPNGPFEPPITSPHLVRSFSTFGMSIWTLEVTNTQTETNCTATNVMRASIPILYGSKTDEKRGSYGPKLRKNGPTLSQILLSVVDKTAYLGGNVCAKILSDPLQLGPRAKTLRQEVHFSYHTQLSDRQELLRSSRNLSQKMTPWHKEHSDGLRSQDHILRTQARLCARPVPLENRVFLTRNKLIHKPGHVGKKTHSCTTWNSRIAKILSGQAGILIGKLPSNGPKTLPVASVRGAISHKSKLGFPANPEPCKSRQRKLSDGTKNVENPTSGARVFPARNKLIYEPGCVGKITTPGYVVELSVRRKHPPFDRNLHRKSARKQLRYPDFREP
uniref:Uncharacterized protein n=2 Tax=Fagus sylvatica TaxID=28930 RepID=A0A2N9GMW6_FAGSY